MSFGRRQPRQEPSAAVLAPPMQPAAVPQLDAPSAENDNLLHCANAVTDLVAMLLAAYAFQDRLQAAPAISAAAALTGEFALRASGVPIPESGAVPGDAANDVLFAGASEGRATAWMFMMHAAVAAGVPEYDLPKIERVAAEIARLPGEGIIPLLTVSERYVPVELPLNIGPRFRHRVIAIADAHDLSLREITIALAAATGQLIVRAQHDMPPQIAATLAAEIMLAVARRAPLSEPVLA